MTMRIGVVTGDSGLLELLQKDIQACGHEAIVLDDLSDAVAAEPNLVFAEWLEGEYLASVLDGLQAAVVMENPIPIVIFVPVGGVTAMRRARAAGATDVLFLPPDSQEIRAEIGEVCTTSTALYSTEKARFREIVQDTLVGESSNFRKCLEEIRLAARCDANILLVGETGTGKEMFAQAIHRLSRRSGNPYVAVNCASLPENLLESELFGHEKGAFTGADTPRCGRFEAAGAGTLLLDEIGDTKPALQVKLLRVIEQRVFQRLGENKDVPFNARLICATSADLDNAASHGRFRRDLLGRIDQFRIALPPLRERRIDIPILVRHFIRKHARGRRVEISRTTMEVLENYDFPMNIRQLENALVGALARSDPGSLIPPKRLPTRSDPGSLILPKHLPKEITVSKTPKTKDLGHTIGVPNGLSYEGARAHVCQAIDKLYLISLLRKHGGNHTRAAKEAGIDRKTFAARLDEVLRHQDATDA